MAEEKSKIDIIIETANAAKNVGELRKALKQLSFEQENIDKTSPDFDKLAETINDVEGRIGDLTDSMRTLTGSGVERLNSATGLLNEGFQNLDTGKLGIGIKGLSKVFQDTAKSIGGLKLGNLKQGFSELGKSGVGELTKSIIQLGKAILTNPILLIAAVVIGIIAVMVKFKDSIKPIKMYFDLMGKAIDVVVQALKDFADWMGISAFAAEDAAKKQLAANESLQKNITRRYETEIKLAEAAGQDTFSLEKRKQLAIQVTTKKQIEALEAIRRANGTLTEDQVKQLDELKIAYEDTFTEISVLNAKRAKEEKDKADADAKKKADEDKKKAEEARKRAEEAAKQKAADNEKLKKLIEDQEVALIQDEEKRALAKAELDNKRAIEEINKSKADKAIKDRALIDQELSYLAEVDKIKKEADDKRKEEEKKKAEEAKNDRINALNEVNALEQADFDRQIIEAGNNEAKIANIKIQALRSERDTKLAIAKETGENIDLINKEYANKELEIINEIAKAKEEAAKKEIDDQLTNSQKNLQIGIDTVNALTSLSDGLFAMKKSNLEKGSQAEQDAAKKNFEINKKMQLASAVISGIQSVLAAYQNGMKNPVPLLGPATAAIYATLAGITALGNIAKIKATTFEGGGNIGGASGGGGGGPRTGGGGAADTSNQVRSAQFYGLGQMRQQSGAATQKVVVVESDITRAQNNVSKIETRATQTL